MVTEKGRETTLAPALNEEAGMVYTYEADIEYSDEDGTWYVEFTQFPGAFADGDTVEEAAKAASDVLSLFIAEYLDEDIPLPKPSFHEPPKTIVSVDVTDEFRAVSKCVTVTEAAEMLEVSPGRVSQLLSSGGLEPYMHGNTRLVTIASLNARMAAKPSTGRPRKEAVLA